MFINGIEFLTALTRKIILFTVEHIPSHTAAQISSSLNKIVKIYARTGFIFHVIFMDMEFKEVSNDMDLIQVNTTSSR